LAKGDWCEYGVLAHCAKVVPPMPQVEKRDELILAVIEGSGSLAYLAKGSCSYANVPQSTSSGC